MKFIIKLAKSIIEYKNVIVLSAIVIFFAFLFTMIFAETINWEQTTTGIRKGIVTEPYTNATTIQQDKISVTPYTEATATYTNVKAIEIYNASKNIRVGFDDTTTADSDNYWVIPSSAVGFDRNNLNVSSLEVRLKGDTSSDTATVRINVYK